MMEWQPIETAPKDGTVVLGYWPSEYAPTSASYGLTLFMHGGWCMSEDLDHEYSDPSFWQALPPPPTEKDKG
jgi:hypothetical protein